LQQKKVSPNKQHAMAEPRNGKGNHNKVIV